MPVKFDKVTFFGAEPHDFREMLEDENRSPDALENMRQEHAAWLIADAKLNMSEVAKKVGVSYSVIWSWRSDPKFVSRVNMIKKMMADEIRDFFFADRRTRIQALQDKAMRIEHIVTTRARQFEESHDLEASGGGDSGLILRQYKSIGSGPMAEAKVEYSFDATMIREYRALMSDIEKETAGLEGRENADTPSGAPPIREVVIYLTTDAPGSRDDVSDDEDDQ